LGNSGLSTELMFKRLQDGARKEVDLRCLAQHASGEDVNAANNPLTPKITINFHDSGRRNSTISMRSRMSCSSAA
jgi:hypothetical protein